jgi:hypothetical protein
MKKVYFILAGLLLIGASYVSADVSAKAKLPTVYLDVGQSVDLIGNEVAVISTSYALEPLFIELNSVEYIVPQLTLLTQPDAEVPLIPDRWQGSQHDTLTNSLKSSIRVTYTVSSYPDYVMLC